MNRKIEIVQELSESQSWHWIILEYDSTEPGWHNVRSGLEDSYDVACSKAKAEYDSLKNNAKEQSCCFTGHRSIPKDKVKELRLALHRQIQQFYNSGITIYYVGGAIGFDMHAARMILALKKVHPEVKLIAMLPFQGYMSRWSSQLRALQEGILSQCDEVRYFGTSYDKNLYRVRDEAMVDAAGYCISYCTNPRSGTGMTVRYAEKQGLWICNLAELTREVESDNPFLEAVPGKGGETRLECRTTRAAEEERE